MNLQLRSYWLAGTVVAGVLLYLLAPVLTPFIAAALLAYLELRLRLSATDTPVELKLVL